MKISPNCLQEILDEAYEAICVMDFEYNILFANKAAHAIRKDGVQTSLIGKKCYQCLVGCDTPCRFCKRNQLTEDRFLVRNFRDSDGAFFELRGKLMDWDGIPAHIEFIRNITEQNFAEKRSEELAIQQKNLYEHIGIGMCLYQFQDGEMRALVFNDTYRQLFQLPEGFDEGTPIHLQLQNFYGSDREGFLDDIREHVRKGTSFHRVCQVLDQVTGLPRSILVNAECAPQEGQYTLWYVSAYDVTKWMDSENRLENVLSSINGGIAVYQIRKSGRARRLMYTDGLLKMQGYSRQEYEELARDDALNLVYPEDRELLLTQLTASCRNQTPFSTTYRVCHKEKGYIWVNLTATPIGLDSEGCLRYNAAFTNVSQQFELYRQLLDNSENGLIVTDQNTNEVYFTNQAARRILDASPNKCAGTHICLDPAADRHTLCDDCELLPRQTTQPRKMQFDGKTYQIYTHPMEWMDRPASARYFSDISEETELQSRLASDEERYRLVVEKSGIALLDYNIKTDTLYINDRFRQYAASARPDICDFPASINDESTIHPEDLSLLKAFRLDLDRDHAASSRVRLRMLDGTFRWTEMGALEICNDRGELLRKIGFFRDVDDITHQYEDLKIRYDYEMARLNSFEEGVVERMLLDLTDNRIVQAANPHSASLKQLTGMSIDDLLAARLAHTQEEKERAQLKRFMNRDALLQAYYTGETPSLEMMALVHSTGEKRHFISTAQLAKNPGNGHIIAFIETRDNDLAVMESTLMRKLLETNYELAVVVASDTGKIKIGIRAGEKAFATSIAMNYDELTAESISRRVLAEEREQTLAQMSLAAIREALEHASHYTGRITLELDGERYYKMWNAVYFDDNREYILVTLANVTEVYKRDLQTARELKEALENAKVASRAKTTFLARMSHEIRTPITTVSGVLDLIRIACRKNDIQPEELLRQVDTADAANQYLLTLINDLLDISKIESNELHLNPVPTDIREIIVPMCAMIQPLADKKKIHLVLNRKTRTSNWYRMDGVRVQQILMNLLSNAIKFTPEGGTVTFTGEVTQEDTAATVTFVVRDTGVGISEDFKKDVFEPFRQEYTDSKSGYGGTGIGLSISRQLARMMGGDIIFESEKGKGSTFTATMQLEIVPEQETETGHSSTHEPEQPLLNGIHVLLCEDNEINQLLVQKLLESGGCRVTTADDGKEALDLFSASPENTFSLILMDIRMPRMDGLEATRQIRALSRPDAQTVPIVAMSANAYEEDHQMSLAAGMNEHLSKPVNTEELYRTIHHFCRQG